MKRNVFFFFLQLAIYLQCFSQNKPIVYDRWEHPVLLQMKKPLNVIPFAREKGGNYVSMTAVDKPTKELYWITAFGEIFDSVPLSDREYVNIVSKKISPFDYYNTIANTFFEIIEDSKYQLRTDGKITKNQDYINAVLSSPEIKNAPSTLKKYLLLIK